MNKECSENCPLMMIHTASRQCLAALVQEYTDGGRSEFLEQELNKGVQHQPLTRRLRYYSIRARLVQSTLRPGIRRREGIANDVHQPNITTTA